MEYEVVLEVDDLDDEDEVSFFIICNGYILQEIFSDFDELFGWRFNNFFIDFYFVQNVLLMRVSCYNCKYCWLFFIDFDN